VVASMVAVVLTACGGSDGGTTDGGSPTATVDGPFPTSPDGAGAGGTAHVEIEGGPTYDASLAGLGQDQDFPPDAVSLYWAAEEGDLTLRFPAFTGTKPTSTSPRIELVIVAGDGLYLGSNGGECEITVTTADPSAVVGSFECTFSSDPKRASGTFEARAS